MQYPRAESADQVRSPRTPPLFIVLFSRQLVQASPSVACPRGMVMLSQFPVRTHFHPLFLTVVALSVAHQSPGVRLKCEFSSL